MNINALLDIFILFVGIVTVSKYIVLFMIKGVIKFKLIKNKHNKIIVKEYIFFYDKK